MLLVILLTLTDSPFARTTRVRLNPFTAFADGFKKVTGPCLYIWMFWAILYKRSVVALRSYKFSLVQLLVPSLFLTLTWVSRDEHQSDLKKQEVMLKLDLSQFDSPTVPYRSTENRSVPLLF